MQYPNETLGNHNRYNRKSTGTSDEKINSTHAIVKEKKEVRLTKKASLSVQNRSMSRLTVYIRKDKTGEENQKLGPRST